MVIIRILVGAVVVTLGLLFAAFVMVLGLVAYVVQRLFGKPGRRPVFQYQYSFSRGAATPPRPPRRAPVGEVIDVEVVDAPAIEDGAGPGQSLGRR
ncbi:MAG: hypothetical protein ABII82_04820 [Verrucomicrobiota bacterium]